MLGIIGTVIAVAALVVAVPPFIQMVYGRPKLNIGFDEFTGPDGKLLLMNIQNQPVKSRFLKLIHVMRETGEVAGFFDIKEQGTNKYIAKDIAGHLAVSVSKQKGTLVRALPVWTIALSIIHFRENLACIVDANKGDSTTIAKGDYIVEAMIICGEQVQNVTRTLKVGDAAYNTFWS